MCGRYVLRKKSSREEHLEYDHGWNDYWDILHLEENLEHSRFNIGPHPRLTAPIITREGYREMFFGIKPEWAKSMLINAKSENLGNSRFWKPMAAMRPCLVPAHGFYEPKGDKGPKRPWYGFEFKQQHGFFMAGIWKAVEQNSHFVILTRPPDSCVGKIHSRMPVIFNRKQADSANMWMDTSLEFRDRIAMTQETLEYPDLESFPVSDAAKNLGNEGKALFSPLE